VKKITVIYNNKAGAGEQLAALKAAFVQNKTEASFVVLSEQTKIDNQTQLLVAAGGDGTVNAVAQMALDMNLPMAVLPAGTLNHFAKDLGVPTDLAEAVGLLTTGKEQTIDVAAVNDRIFLNNSSLGIYPEIVRQREGRYGWLSKWPAAMLSFARVMTHLKRYHLQIAIDGQPPLKRTTPFVFVGNNSYGIDELGLSNRATLDGGTLCLYLIRSHRLLDLVRIAWRSLWGHARYEDDLETFKGANITITAPHPLSVAYDGEVNSMDMPLRYEIKPKVLRVIIKAKAPLHE